MATLAAGTVLSISTDGGTTFTQIKGISSAGSTGQTKSEVDVTPLEATSKEYIAGMSDGESKTITVYRDKDDAGQNALKKAGVDGDVVDFKIELSNGEVGTFQMAMLGWVVDDPSADSAIMATANGRMTGDVTWA